jgi:hypothetical protein
MNAAPAVALPFSSHARLGGAPPRPALRLAGPDDTPALRDTPALHDTPALRPSHLQSHPQARPSSRPQAQPRLRLTRRGRIVAAILAALIVSAFCLIAANAAQATNHGAPAGHSVTQVTVQPGQSLWSVAENADPSQDTRSVIQQITELNGLNGQVVFSGERLWVPRG